MKKIIQETIIPGFIIMLMVAFIMISLIFAIYAVSDIMYDYDTVSYRALTQINKNYKY